MKQKRNDRQMSVGIRRQDIVQNRETIQIETICENSTKYGGKLAILRETTH